MLNRMIIEYSREDCVKYISHLDLIRAFQRAIRRADIPIAYSQGFNPHPRMAFASALPVGVVSFAEYMDIYLNESMDAMELVVSLNNCLPKGLAVSDAASIDESTPSLMSLIEKASYMVEIESPDIFISGEDIHTFLGQSEIIIEKQGKKGPQLVDIKDGIFDINIESDSRNKVHLSLRTGSQGNIKPEAVVNALFKSMVLMSPAEILLKIYRTGLYIQKDHHWVTPLSLKRG